MIIELKPKKYEKIIECMFCKTKLIIKKNNTKIKLCKSCRKKRLGNEYRKLLMKDLQNKLQLKIFKICHSNGYFCLSNYKSFRQVLGTKLTTLEESLLNQIDILETYKQQIEEDITKLKTYKTKKLINSEKE